MGWNEVLETAGSQDFLQVKNGETKKFHIILKEDEEPVSYHTHYIPQANDGKGWGIVCPGVDVCPCCADIKVYPIRARHSVNVWDFDSESVKIFESGNIVFKQIKAVFDEMGDLTGIDFKMSRIGDKLKTKYTLISMPTKFKEDIDALELKDLDALSIATSIKDIKILMGGGRLSSDEETESVPEKSVKKKVPIQEELPADAATELDRADLLAAVNENFTSMARYDKITNIRVDMAKVSKSKKNPAGKMLLKDLSDEELQSLLDLQTQLG